MLGDPGLGVERGTNRSMPSFTTLVIKKHSSVESRLISSKESQSMSERNSRKASQFVFLKRLEGGRGLGMEIGAGISMAAAISQWSLGNLDSETSRSDTRALSLTNSRSRQFEPLVGTLTICSRFEFAAVSMKSRDKGSLPRGINQSAPGRFASEYKTKGWLQDAKSAIILQAFLR